MADTGIFKVENKFLVGFKNPNFKNNLKNATIPDGVEQIGHAVFSDCANLETVVIPEGVTTISYDAFKDCKNLQSVTIPASMKTVDGGIFDGCGHVTVTILGNGTNSKAIADKLHDEYGSQVSIMMLAEEKNSDKKEEKEVAAEQEPKQEQPEVVEEKPEVVPEQQPEQEEVVEEPVKEVEQQEAAAEKQYSTLPASHEKSIKIVGSDSKKIKQMTQNISLISDNPDAEVETLMNFAAPVNGQQSDFLGVYRQNDNCWVEIKVPDAFVDQNGANLKANSKVKFDNDILKLKVDPTKTGASPIDIRGGNKDDEQLVVTIISEDNVKYKIVVTATSVDVEIDGESYLYSVQKEDENCIDAEFNVKTIEELLSNPVDKNKPDKSIIARAEKQTDIPIYLLGMYFSTLAPNQAARDFGKFSLMKYSLTGKEEDSFCIFRNSSAKDKSMYLYSEGKLIKCTSYSYQYVEEGGQKKAYLVLNSEGSKAAYYKFDLGTITRDENGVTLIDGQEPNADQNKQAVFNFLKSVGVNKDLSTESDKNEKYDINGFVCTQADGRTYKEYIDVVRSKQATHVLVEPAQPQKETKDKKPKEKPEEQQEEQQEKSQEDNAPETEKREGRDYKKTVEALGNGLAAVGCLMALAALIPGIGLVMAIIGAAAFMAGEAMVLTAEKFKFDPYEVAKRKLGQYVDHQAEEFLDAEDDLESLIANSNEAANEVERVSTISPIEGGNQLAHAFMEQYEKNGLAFDQEGDFAKRATVAQDINRIRGIEDESEREREIQNFIQSQFGDSLDPQGVQNVQNMFANGDTKGIMKLAGLPEQTRYQYLLSREGLSERETMLKEINTINNPNNAARKDELINEFVMTHFDGGISQDDKLALTEMFGAEHQEELADFMDKVSTLNDAQSKETELLNKQKTALGYRTNDQIGRILGHSKLSPERRRDIVERYGVTIIKHLALDNLTQEKVFEVLGNIPETDKADIYEMFVKQTGNFKRDAEHIKDIAAQYSQTEKDISDLDKYAYAIGMATSDQSKPEEKRDLSTNVTLREASTDFNMQYTAASLGNTSAAQNVEWLQDSNTFVSDKKLQNVETVLGNAVTEMVTFEQDELVANFERIGRLANFLDINKDIGEAQYNLYRGEAGQTLQPDMNAPQLDANLSYYELINNEVTARINAIEEKLKTATDAEKVELNNEKAQYSEITKAYSFIRGNRYNFASKNVAKQKLIEKTFKEIQKQFDLKLDDFKGKGKQYNETYERFYQEHFSGLGQFSKSEKEYLAILATYAATKNRDIDALEETINGNSNLSDSEKQAKMLEIAEQRQVYNKILSFTRVVGDSPKEQTNINYAIRYNAFKKHCEQMGYEISEENMTKAAGILAKTCEVKSNQEDMMSNFSKARYDRLKENLGESLTYEDFVKNMKDTLGNDKIEESQPTFQEYISDEQFQLDNKATLNGGTTEQRIEFFNANRVQALRNVNENRSKVQCSSLGAKDGKAFVETQFNYYSTHEKETESQDYLDMMDYLEKRFGIDRYKLIEEQAKLGKGKTNKQVLDELCKKFNITIDEAEIHNLDIKVQQKLYSAENNPNIILTDDEKDRIKLITQGLALKEFEIYFTKLDRYIEEHSYQEILDLCKNQNFTDLMKTMSQDFATDYERLKIKEDFLSVESIVTLLESEEFKDESKQEQMFDNLMKSKDSISRGYITLSSLKRSLDDKVKDNTRKLNQTAGNKALNESLDKQQLTEKRIDMLSKVYNLVTGLERNKGYTKEQIDKLLRDFGKGEFDGITAEFPELTSLMAENQDFIKSKFGGDVKNIRKHFNKVMKKQDNEWTKSQQNVEKNREKALKETSARKINSLQKNALNNSKEENVFNETMLLRVDDLQQMIGYEAEKAKANKEHQTQIESTANELQNEFAQEIEDNQDEEKE